MAEPSDENTISTPCPPPELPAILDRLPEVLASPEVKAACEALTNQMQGQTHCGNADFMGLFAKCMPTVLQMMGPMMQQLGVPPAVVEDTLRTRIDHELTDPSPQMQQLNTALSDILGTVMSNTCCRRPVVEEEDSESSSEDETPGDEDDEDDDSDSSSSSSEQADDC